MFCFDHDMIEENCFVYASTLLLFFVVVVVVVGGVVVAVVVVVVVVGGTDQPNWINFQNKGGGKLAAKKQQSNRGNRASTLTQKSFTLTLF